MPRSTLIISAVGSALFASVRLGAQGTGDTAVGTTQRLGAEQASATTATTNVDTAKRPRWSVSFAVGTTSGGLAVGLEAAMRSAGYDQTTDDGIEHPFSTTGANAVGFSVLARLAYALNPHVAAEFIVANSPIGETLGEKPPFQFLFIDYSVVTLAPLVAWSPVSRLRLGAGPSLSIATAAQTAASSRTESSRRTRLGFVADLQATLIDWSRVVVELSAQYRRVGSVRVGPYHTGQGGSESVMPTASVSYDHWFIGLGPGFRF